MEPTADLRFRLRGMLDATIPPGGTDRDTDFLDGEIDDLLASHTSIEAAAAEGWMRKAGRVMSEGGGISVITAGSERIQFTAAKDLRDHALQMAAWYRGLIPVDDAWSGVSRVYRFKTHGLYDI